MTSWDTSVDLVIIGSGGGGFAAAVKAADAGLRALVVEKQAVVGGSTAMSGGVIWLPNNPLMREEGVADSMADGLAYFDDVVGDVGPASSLARREAFLTEGSEMVDFLRARGLHLVRCPGYSDYYPNHRGGNAAGRSIEPVPYDARELGEWQHKVQPGMAKGIGLVAKTNEIRSIQYYNRSAGSFAIAARVWLRTMAARARGQDLLTNGAALIAQLLNTTLAMSVPVWTETRLDELVVDGDRVVGVRLTRGDGSSVAVDATRGVLLAAGGFARNPAMRRKYGAAQPNEAEWTVSNPGDTGEALETAMALGARTDLMDEAWWLPSPVDPNLAGSTLNAARQRPGAIFVNAAGERFCNESNSYVEVGKAMYANDGVPCWVIHDDGYRRRYAAAKSLPGRLPAKWIESGALKRADTIEGLATQIGVDPAALGRTVSRFNENAKRGLDPDFGRGQSAYNICLGDPGYKPNAALGPLDRAPFYAAAIYPSDVGTCGGLVTDEHARVLTESSAPIPGLYATGNITATVMGRKYLGAGASIANTMVFGYVAAKHAAASS